MCFVSTHKAVNDILQIYLVTQWTEHRTEVCVAWRQHLIYLYSSINQGLALLILTLIRLSIVGKDETTPRNSCIRRNLIPNWTETTSKSRRNHAITQSFKSFDEMNWRNGNCTSDKHRKLDLTNLRCDYDITFSQARTIITCRLACIWTNIFAVYLFR